MLIACDGLLPKEFLPGLLKWLLSGNCGLYLNWHKKKIPECVEHLGSLEFSKRLLTEAGVAVAPGVGFGVHGEGYVRIALIENDNRIHQAARNIKEFLKQFQGEAKQ